MKAGLNLGLLLVFLAARLEAQNVGFVVDNTLGEVKVVDLAQRAVSATIPVGQEPGEMLILPNNQTAVITNSADNSVAVVDLAALALVATVPAGGAPGSLIGSNDNRFVYVANVASNDVTVIDAVTHSVLTTIPVEVTPVQVNLSPNGRYLYVVNQDAEPTGTVSVVNTSRRAIEKVLSVGLRPVQFALAPTLDRAYVVNSGSNTVSIVDLGSNEVTGEIAVGQGPSSVAFSTDGGFLYVVNRDSNNISVVDTAQRSVIAQMPVGSQPVEMVVTFDSKFGFVSNRGSNNVTLLDLTARTAELTIATGAEPFDLHLDSNEDFLYVTNLGSQSVTVIDVNTDRAVATIPLGGIPVQFTQYNAPTLLDLASNPAPAGLSMVLNGEGFLPSSVVRFVTSAPPRTVIVQPAWLDSQGLEVVVPSMQGSSAVVSMAHADGNSSEQLTLRFGSAAPTILSGGVVEAAGFQPAPYPLSGNAIAAVFGSFPGAFQQEAAEFPLPITLGNAKATFNGVPAPILFSSPGQINVVVPARLEAQTSARVAVTVGNQTSRVETVTLAKAAPGIFQFSTAGDGTFLHLGTPPRRVTASDPARRGETLILFVTGLGETFPLPLDGEPAPLDILSDAVEPISLRVGGIPADILFKGLAPGFSGLYQINFVVPAEAPIGNQVNVVVSSGTHTSNAVRLAVQ